MTRSTSIMMGVLLAGCADPAAGTFVGNPEMAARYLSTSLQTAGDGELPILEMVVDCEGAASDDLGARVLSFEAGVSEAIELPEGTLCSMRLVTNEFRLEFEDEGQTTTVIGPGFDIFFPRTDVERDAMYSVRLGGPDWLAELAAFSVAGETNFATQSPELLEAFLSGLEQDSSFEIDRQ